MKIIDLLSVTIENDVPADPPGLGPRISYTSHAEGAEEVLRFFPGLDIADVPGSEGWAVEQLSLTAHAGTHLDAPWHFASTMNNGERAWTIDEIDALASSRGNENDIGEARRVLNSFLQFLDEDTGPSIIIATTNLPELLDRAVLRRFDLVLSYDLPNEDAIEKAMRRRLHGFDVGAINWSQITGCADGLSTADVIAAAEDAARRAVILDSGAVETSAVVASLERRRSLQGIGTDKHGSRSAPLHTERNRKSTPVRSKNRRIVKTSE